MEIEVPKSVRPIMLDAAEETMLGDPEGARRQYRYGNLHIREYDDKYVVHVDKFDPRKEPVKHLLFDTPEVLIGTAIGLYTGFKVGSMLSQDGNKVSNALLIGTLAAITSGYATYNIVKWIKRKLL
jgi:hypothetical protein